MTTQSTNQKAESLSDSLSVFSLNKVPVRGRLIASSGFADDIVRLHGYPDKVNVYLRETMMMSALFASLFKFDGIFSIQVNAEGPIRTLACDVTSAGDVRAYASFDEELLAKTKSEDIYNKGHIILTVDNTGTGKRYQGIVEIQDKSIAKSFVHYFNQSEQIPTSIQYFLRGDKAAAMILQHLPDEGGNLDKSVSSETEEEGWNRVMVLASSCTEDEIFDTALSDEQLIFRLFHEDGVTAYDPRPLQAKCRCSQEKAEAALHTLTAEQLMEMAADGNIEMDCEFCNTQFVFDPAEIARKLES